MPGTAILQIKDEVNLKIAGLELDARRALMQKFEYEVPGARYMPSVKLGRWNGKVSYCSLAGSTFINLLPEIVPILEQLNYEIELEDLSFFERTRDKYLALAAQDNKCVVINTMQDIEDVHADIKLAIQQYLEH